MQQDVQSRSIRPRTSNQKKKLLYLIDLFLSQTDEAHSLSMADILASLARQGIDAERKSIYADIEQLTDYGFEIQLSSDKKSYFYAGGASKEPVYFGRNFELPELKLLIDSIQSSKFVSEKKSNELIRKLQMLCSKHEARELQRGVVLTKRVKNATNGMYNVDALHRAIHSNLQISFRYFNYDLMKKKNYREKQYIQSPFALIYADDNYYMLAYDAEALKFKHFRVDKMDMIRSLVIPREGYEQFKKLDMSTYTKQTFSMFGGESVVVTMRFVNAFAGVVIDRFGQETLMLREDNDHFTVSVPVAVSDQFFAWVVSFGKQVKILSPQSVVDQMVSLLEGVRSCYEG